MRREAEEARAAHAAEEARGQRALRCPHCGNTTFETQSVLLNTRGLTFFNLDWLNRSATAYCCRNCGLIQWFLEE
ncbi:MAG: DNA-binding protein [Acidobacteria bacterium]|nr:MAG: DNA-binding protein [Acidobacteriota bacterium]